MSELEATWRLALVTEVPEEDRTRVKGATAKEKESEGGTMETGGAANSSFIDKGATKKVFLDPTDENRVVYRFRGEAKVRQARYAAALKGLADLDRLLRADRSPGLNCGGRFIKLVGVMPDKHSIVVKPRGLNIYGENVEEGRWRLVNRNDARLLRSKQACLASWQEGTSVIDASVLRDLMVDVALAVLCLHSNGRAHGDLKPAQVLVDCVATDGASTSKLVALLADLDGLMPFSATGEALVHECGDPSTFSPPYASKGRLEWRNECRAKRLILASSTYNAVADDLHALKLLLTDLSLIWLMDLDRVMTSSAQALLSECVVIVRAKVVSIRTSSHFGQVLDLWHRWCDEFSAELRDMDRVKESLKDSHRRLYKKSPREGEEEELFPSSANKPNVAASSALGSKHSEHSSEHRAEHLVEHDRRRGSTTACMQPGCFSGLVKSLMTSHDRERGRPYRPNVNL
jgi:hypothetical protein